MNYDGRQHGGNTSLIVANLKLQRLLTPALNTNWIVNSYDSAGRRVTTGGTFEGVIETATGGIAVRTFRYLSSATQLEVVLTV